MDEAERREVVMAKQLEDEKILGGDKIITLLPDG